MRVAVVGAGVVGVTSALAVKNAFPAFEVQIFADCFSPDTTGDGSAGLWGPYLLGDTATEDVLRWAGRTHEWLSHFWKAGFSSETGVALLPLIRVTSDPKGFSDCSWTKLVYGAHKITPEELQKLNEEHKANYTEGWHFVTFTGEPVRLLPWLTDKFVAMGGKVQRRKILELGELIDEGYDLIINCSGLGARELVNDSSTAPIRGQVMRVKAPWAMHGYLVEDDDGNYIIPNIDSLVLGGTHQEGDFDCTVRKKDSKFIHDGCCRLLPALKGARTMKEWVGLRPGRSQVRLELDAQRTSKGQKFMVIHNYGHGGSGITLCWGCALDVVEMIRNMKTGEHRARL
ncbi:hypothetical protein KM043_005558 [Ampulex compressa]|nr:hypothetical protein KM043_005558 [Ampulex compressa]